MKKITIKKNVWLIYLIWGLIIFATSFFLALLTQGSMSEIKDMQFSWDYSWSFYLKNSFWLWMNISFFAILIIFFSALFNSILIGDVVVIILGLTFTYANWAKMSARTEPVFPNEISMITNFGELSKMINLGQVLLILGGVTTLLGGAIWFHFWLKKRITIAALYQPKKTSKYRFLCEHNFIYRIVLIVPTFILIMMFHNIGNDQATIAKYIANNNYYNNRFNQTQNYRTNSFTFGFLYNSSSEKMEKPAGYSEAAIKKIVDKYNSQAEQSNFDTNAQMKTANINVILSESLADINQANILSEYSYISDPTPFMTSLKKQGYFGHMASPEYGGGTANIEFEVMTSFSRYFVNSYPYQDILPNFKSFPSFASYLDESGYSSEALHSFSKNMYKRDIVYPKIGIDTFLDQTKLKNLKQSNFTYYTSDESLFNNLTSVWMSDKKQFYLTLTMQNHMPYNMDRISPYLYVTKKDGYEITKQQMASMSHYANALRDTDNALKKLNAKVQKQTEPTVVLVFGDHRPGEIFAGGKDNLSLEEHETPYFILTNIPLLNKKLPTVSPNQLIPTLINEMNLPQSGWYNLLTTLQKKIPILTKVGSSMTKSTTDNIVLASTKTVENQQVFQDYQMINYDMYFGKQYAQKHGFFKKAQTSTSNLPSPK